MHMDRWRNDIVELELAAKFSRSTCTKFSTTFNSVYTRVLNVLVYCPLAYK
jgi:hypothetical protein